jgi:Guanylate-binding protein, N-terminal domain
MSPIFLRFLALSYSIPGSFPHFEPIQVIRPSKDRQYLEVTEEIAKLQGLTTRIAIIAVTGPFHSGKSFLLNSLAGRTDVFTVGADKSPETTGIWLARTDRRARNGAEIWLMDCEGFFGPRVRGEYDAKIFTLAALLSSHLVYNSVKTVQQNDVNLIERVTMQAKLFKLRTNQSPEPIRELPDLTWVVEDFAQESENAHQEINITQDYDCEYLKEAFGNVTVSTLFLPATSRKELADLSKLTWDELTPEYRVEVSKLRGQLYDSIDRQTHVWQPDELLKSLHFLTNGLRQGKFPELPSILEIWHQDVKQASEQDSLSALDSRLKGSLDDVYPPVALQKLTKLIKDGEESAVSLYRTLMKEFEQSDAFPKGLNDKIRARIEASKHLHEQKATEYLHKLHVDKLTSFRNYVSEMNFPLDPDVLAISLKVREAETIRYYTEIANEISVPTNSSVLEAQLRDISSNARTVNMEKIENSTLSALQKGMQAYERCASEMDEKLLGSAELVEQQSRMLEVAREAFYTSLKGSMGWLSLGSHSSSKHIVADATKRLHAECDSRFTRLTQSMNVRLQDHFRRIADLLLGEYQELRRHLEMKVLPAEAEYLRHQFESVEKSILDKLSDSAPNLTDTPHFEKVTKRLHSVFKKENDKVARKNVELWKVHSDEATQCALDLNKKYKQYNCWNSWLCLFSLIPASHRAKTQENLNNCFNKSSSNMPSSMRKAVFESWYEKDLAADSNEVTRNMWLTVISLVLPASWFLLSKAQRSR